MYAAFAASSFSSWFLLTATHSLLYPKKTSNTNIKRKVLTKSKQVLITLVTRGNVVSTVIVAKWKLNKHGHWPAQIWQLCKYCAETCHRGSKKVEEELQNYFSSQFCKLPYFCDERLGLANMFCKYVTHFLCNQLSCVLHFFSGRLRANTAHWICANCETCPILKLFKSKILEI